MSLKTGLTTVPRAALEIALVGETHSFTVREGGGWWGVS